MVRPESDADRHDGNSGAARKSQQRRRAIDDAAAMVLASAMPTLMRPCGCSTSFW
jgi:hypothetical protein